MTKREIINTTSAPKAIGPYSQAIRVPGLVFTSGQLGIDPSTGTLVEGNVEAQTRQALRNLSNVLEAAGSSLKNIVKTTLFLAAISDFHTVNRIYEELFPEKPPARTTFEASNLPMGALVEIEAIAIADSDY